MGCNLRANHDGAARHGACRNVQVIAGFSVKKMPVANSIQAEPRVPFTSGAVTSRLPAQPYAGLQLLLKSQGGRMTRRSQAAILFAGILAVPLIGSAQPFKVDKYDIKGEG